MCSFLNNLQHALKRTNIYKLLTLQTFILIVFEFNVIIERNLFVGEFVYQISPTKNGFCIMQNLLSLRRICGKIERCLSI